MAEGIRDQAAQEEVASTLSPADRDKLEELKKVPSKAAVNSDRQKPKIEDTKVYAMPSKFLVHKPPTITHGTGEKKPKKPKGNLGKILFITIILIIIIGGAVGFGVWYIFQQNDTISQVNIDLTNTIAVDDSETSTDTDTNNSDDSETSTDTDTNNGNDSDTGDEDNLPPPIIDLNPDNDEDGLSNEEEVFYSTNPEVSDTDRDGFSDRMEIINLFNPLAPNETLLDSGLIAQYRNGSFGYSIYRPKTWVSSAITIDTSEVNFLPDSESGDFISIVLSPNKNNLTLAQLQSGFFSSGPRPVNFTIAEQPALRTDSKVLMVTTDYIYYFSYETINLNKLIYGTTFEMMLKSFELGPTEEINF